MNGFGANVICICMFCMWELLYGFSRSGLKRQMWTFGGGKCLNHFVSHE